PTLDSARPAFAAVSKSQPSWRLSTGSTYRPPRALHSSASGSRTANRYRPRSASIHARSLCASRSARKRNVSEQNPSKRSARGNSSGSRVAAARTSGTSSGCKWNRRRSSPQPSAKSREPSGGPPRRALAVPTGEGPGSAKVPPRRGQPRAPAAERGRLPVIGQDRERLVGRPEPADPLEQGIVVNRIAAWAERVQRGADPGGV